MYPKLRVYLANRNLSFYCNISFYHNIGCQNRSSDEGQRVSVTYCLTCPAPNLHFNLNEYLRDLFGILPSHIKPRVVNRSFRDFEKKISTFLSIKSQSYQTFFFVNAYFFSFLVLSLSISW